MGLVQSRKLAVVTIVAVIVLDQLTKWFFYDYLVTEGRRFVEVLSFFNLVTVWNYGVSFGMFNSGSAASAWIFALLALGIVALLVYWLWRSARMVPVLALSLVIGGALGNVIDRFRFGAVFDFLDFHAFGWHWPAFNIADAGITVGVAVLFVDSLFGEPDESKKEA
jgi:signal peptidase II